MAAVEFTSGTLAVFLHGETKNSWFSTGPSPAKLKGQQINISTGCRFIKLDFVKCVAYKFYVVTPRRYYTRTLINYSDCLSTRIK